ncbi:SDR family NAD(P)-dependent oxidoreductase [Actinoplanes sp. NPDC026670]|uniref:SDR family NAD(P)-dependent oxidoreductase n=1 Tax=Actinoplanes sp. NPDC026670 TaxID=3154700 RepID=UPI003410CC04
MSNHALITGAGTGIGLAIATRMAADGRNLILVGRDGARLDDTAHRLRAEHGIDVLTVPLDLSRPDAPAELAARVAGLEVDVLINNAGVAHVGTVATTGPGLIRETVEVNATALAETTARFLPAMLARGRGAVINIASTAAYTPAPWNAAYAASKAFVLSFTRALAIETEGTGVRVVAVSPGAVETPMNPGHFRGKRRPDQVAGTVMAALRGRTPAAVVDGRLYAAQAFVFGRLLPTRTAARMLGRFFARAAAAQP